jgi:hypothetical protein
LGESTAVKKRWVVKAKVIYDQENPGRAIPESVPDARFWKHQG